MKTHRGESSEGDSTFSCPGDLEDLGVSSPMPGLLQELLGPGNNNNNNSDNSSSDRDSEETRGGEGDSDSENNNERKEGGCNRNYNNNDNNKSNHNSTRGGLSNKSDNRIDSSDDSNSNNNNNINNDIETRPKDSNGNVCVGSYNRQPGAEEGALSPSAVCQGDECCLQSASCDGGESARRGRERTGGCVGAGEGGGRASQNSLNNNSDWSDAVAKCPKAFSGSGCAAGIHTDAGESSSHVRRRGGTAKVLNGGMSLSPRLKELLQGLNEPGDSGNPPEPPDWLDRRLFNRGRQFYSRFLFCIFFSDLLALLMMFTVSRILRPLIYTGRSDTPHRALRRYVSTVLHVVAWYSGDVWDPEDPAHRDVLSVRAIHSKSARVLNSSTEHEKVAAIDVRARGHEEPRCPFSPAVRHDLRHQAEQGLVLETPDDPPLYISQWDMLVTQYSFLGVLVAHPRKMGAWWASEEDLAGLIHFWRGIGWLLGVEDKYNFCNGSVADTRALCLEIERHLIVPGFAAADWSHEHMATSLMTGMNHMVPCVSYPAMLRFLADTLGVRLPSFVRQMSLRHTCQYWLMRFVFHVLFLIPGVVFLFNELLLFALRFIQEKNPAWRLKSERYNVKSFPHVYA